LESKNVLDKEFLVCTFTLNKIKGVLLHATVERRYRGGNAARQ